MCFNENVFLWSLPANTSHFLQPLDNLCFAQLKNKFKSKLHEVNLKSYFTNSDIKKELFAAMYEAENESMIPKIIISSFKNTGLYPFNEDTIRNLTKENCGKLTVSKDTIVNELSNRLESIIDDIKDKPYAENVSQDNSQTEFFNSPQKLIENKEKKDAEMKQRDQNRNEKKRLREEKKLASIERRIRNKCVFIECTIVKQERSTWQRCIQCNRFICPKHSKMKSYYESICTHEYME